MTTHTSTDHLPSTIRFGPSGWSYADWAGIVYPSQAGRTFDPLAYIALFFDAVEVNVSFYRPLNRRMTTSWVRRVAMNTEFRFTVKLLQRFTHGDPNFTHREIDAFVDPLSPLADAGLLGCILMQFPWSFRRAPESTDRFRRLSEALAGFPRVAEFRHDSWDSEETLADCRSVGCGFCNIDQPALRGCLSPTSYATSDVGYVRLHGRRADTWFSGDASPAARYDYLYSPEELSEWLPRIRDVSRESKDLYVFANNHFRGQAPANALQLRSLLSGARVDVPPDLASTYPALSAIRRDDADGFRETLF